MALPRGTKTALPRDELLVAVVASDGGLLDGTVHPFDLSVGPGMLHLGRAMLAAVLSTGAPEDVLHGRAVLLAVFELDAVVGEDRVDLVGNCRDEMAQEFGCDHLGGPLVQFDIGELGRPMDGHEEIELAFRGLHLGDVDVEVSDGELRLGRLVAFDVRRCRQRCRDERVRVGIVGCSAYRQSSSGSSVCRRKATITASSSIVRTVEGGFVGPVATSQTDVRPLPLNDRLLVDPFGQRPQALLDRRLKLKSPFVAATQFPSTFPTLWNSDSAAKTAAPGADLRQTYRSGG
jgi:hypothetical protein